MSRLFHISEEPGIEVFHPRPAPANRKDIIGNQVWAVDETHLGNYLLPRDCPRVTFAIGPETTEEDQDWFRSQCVGDRVIAVESEWFPRIRSHRLIRYEFDPSGFELQDSIAGYWISRRAVKPIAEVTIESAIDGLLALGVELRVTPSLWPIRETVIHSTLEFSIIRMRNASVPKERLDKYYPLP